MANNPFDAFDSQGASNPFDEFDAAPAVPKEKSWMDIGMDYSSAVRKGLVSASDSVVGAVDFVVPGNVGRAYEKATGYDSKAAKAYWDSQRSDEQKTDQAAVSEAYKRGFIPGLVETVSRPSTIGYAALESLPQMATGGVYAKGLSTASRLAPVAAGALGEGAVGGTAAAERYRQENEEGSSATPTQLLYAAGEGAGTAVLGYAGGRLSQRLGVSDVDTAMAGSKLAPTDKGLIRRVGEGAVSEGVFEEAPQSAWEHTMQSAEAGRPISEGMGEAVGMGMLTGSAMGGGINVFKGEAPAKPISQVDEEQLLPLEGETQDMFSGEYGPGLRAAPVTEETAVVTTEFRKDVKDSVLKAGGDLDTANAAALSTDEAKSHYAYLRKMGMSQAVAIEQSINLANLGKDVPSEAQGLLFGAGAKKGRGPSPDFRYNLDPANQVPAEKAATPVPTAAVPTAITPVDRVKQDFGMRPSHNSVRAVIEHGLEYLASGKITQEQFDNSMLELAEQTNTLYDAARDPAAIKDKSALRKTSRAIDKAAGNVADKITAFTQPAPAAQTQDPTAPSAVTITDATGAVKEAPLEKKVLRTANREIMIPATTPTATVPAPEEPTDEALVDEYNQKAADYLMSGIPMENLALVQAQFNTDENVGKTSSRVLAKNMGISHEAARKLSMSALSSLKANAAAAGMDWEKAKEILQINTDKHRAAGGDTSTTSYTGGEAVTAVQPDSFEFEDTAGFERTETAEKEGDVAEKEYEVGVVTEGDVSSEEVVMDAAIQDAADAVLEKIDPVIVDLAAETFGEGFFEQSSAKQLWFVKQIDAALRASSGDVASFEKEVSRLRGATNVKSINQGAVQEGSGPVSEAAGEGSADAGVDRQSDGPSEAEAPVIGNADVSKVKVVAKKKRVLVRNSPAAMPSGKVSNPSSVSAVRIAAASVVNDPAKHLQVYATAADVPTADRALFDDGRAATYVPEGGYAIVVADRVEKGDELGIFLHEIGTHAALPAAILNKLAERVNAWAQGKGGAFERGWAEATIAEVNANEKDRVNRGLPKYTPMQRAHEEVALFAQKMVNAKQGNFEVAAFERSLPAGLRTWFTILKDALSKAMKVLYLNPDKFTPQNFVDVVAGHAAKLYAGEIEANNADTFSGDSPAAMPSKDAFTSALGDAIADPKHTVETHGMGYLTLTQLGEVYSKVNSAVPKYLAAVRKMQSTSKQWVQKAARIDVDWARVKDADPMHMVMREATRAGYDPSATRAIPATIAERSIQVAYNKLSPEAKAVFTKARDYYAEMRTERNKVFEGLIGAAFDDRIAKAQAAGDTAAVQRAEDKKAKELAKHKDMVAQVKGPYFPLMRIGKYYVVAMSKELAALEAITDKTKTDTDRIAKLRLDPAHYKTSTFDTLSKARKAERELGKTFASVRHNVVEEENNATKVLSAAGLKDVMDYVEASFSGSTKAVGDQLREMMADLYYQSLPENHALKRELKREGVHGEEMDMRRVFAVSSMQGSHYLSRVKHADDVKAALYDIKAEGRDGTEARDVYNEVAKRAALSMENTQTPVSDLVVSASYLAHLGLSPAFILTNAMQVPMITGPWLVARSNSKAAHDALSDALGKTVGMVKSSYAAQGWRFELDWAGKVSAAEGAMLDALMQRSLIDITIEHDLGAVAGAKHHKIGEALKMASLPVHVTELANRSITALAAYNVAVNSKKMSHEDAVDFAAQAVSTTQLDYSALNAPRHMQRVAGSASLAKVMMQFRKYQQGMLYLALRSMHQMVKGESAEVRKDARRTMLGLGITTAAMAGTVGLPLAGTMFWVAGLIASLFGDDDEEWDAEEEYKDWLADEFGEVGAAIAKGLPAAMLNIDMSKRLGMADLASPLPFARDGKTPRESLGEKMIAAGGAPVSMGLGVWEGMGMVADGDVAKGLEKVVLLKGASNLIKSYRMSDEGLTTKNGEVILPPNKFDETDIFATGLGFQPNQSSTYYEANSYIERKKAAAKDARADLIKEYAQAKMRGESTASVQGDIAEFNSRHPEHGVKIDRSTLYKSVQTRKANAKERNKAGIRTGKANKPYLDDVSYAE